MELISVIVEPDREEVERQEADRREAAEPLSFDTQGSARSLSIADRSRAKQIEVGRLRDSFGKLSEQVSAILQAVRKVGEFQLREVTLQVEISSEGGVQLVGSVKAGVKGAITLKFAAEP